MMQVVVSFNFNEGGECDASCDLSRGVQRPMQENLAKTDFAVEAVSVHVHAHLPIHDVQGDSDGAGNSEGNGNSFTESLRPRLNSLAESSLSQASSGSLMLSGLLIPKSLSSLVTQTQADALLEKSQQSQRSRKGSVTDDSASDMDDVATYWDDEEKIAYGREKVFSYTGYQLQLPSLIGILYAAARILHLDLLPRDFQL